MLTKSMAIKASIPLAFMLMAAQAQALGITPDDTNWYGTETGIPEIMKEISSRFSITLDDPIYKAEVEDNVESGSFKMSYDTTFDNDPGDPSEATIIHLDGTPSIDSSPSYLFVKDGNQDISWYLFDLSVAGLSWNGTDSLELSDFWPQNGAISHVALFSDTAPVPEPATMLLFGTGLVGLVGSRFRKKK